MYVCVEPRTEIVYLLTFPGITKQPTIKTEIGALAGAKPILCPSVDTKTPARPFFTYRPSQDFEYALYQTLGRAFAIQHLDWNEKTRLPSRV